MQCRALQLAVGENMSQRSDIRADFIKRLFAVAISIGFATTFVRMDWVTKAQLPDIAEAQQLAILVTGLVATVLSWDGYLESIATKPLNGGSRYTIDIILVFIYMFFLISSGKPIFWLPVLAIIFTLYVLWDSLSVREYLKAYDTSLYPKRAKEDYRAPLSKVAQVYWRGLTDVAGTDRGPIITLSWAIFFSCLAWMNYNFVGTCQVFAMCTFAIAGLLFYRQDKRIIRSGAHGQTMIVRATLIAALLATAFAYFCIFRVT